MKQSVYPNGTKCFTRRNKLFYVVKRTVLCVETSGFLR